MYVTQSGTITLDATNVAASAYSEWNSGTSYSIGNNVKVTTSTPHKEYEALTANSNKAPADNPSDWLELGATNQYKMLDDYVTSQTENALTIEVTLGVEKANRLYLLNLQATSVQIVVKDSGASTISDETISMSETASGSWSEYFFDDFEYKTNVIYDLPAMYLNMTVELTITHGTTAKCGHCIIGLAKEIGSTNYGVNASITDYSVKDTNDFGETTITQRAFAKRYDCDVFIEHDINGKEYDRVHRLLSNLRSTPCVWDANNENSDRTAFVVYGYYKSYDLVAQYATSSQLNIDIEGLI